MKSLRTDKCEGGSPYTWVKTVLLGRKTSGLFLTQITRPQKTDLLFPSCVEQKRGLIVTQIKWPQQAVLLFPKYVAPKQAGLLLHKLHGRNKQTHSTTMWPQNKWAYCYTNLVATTSRIIVLESQQRFASLLSCWFILAVKVPATRGAAIPQQQNSQHNKVQEIQHSWKRRHKIL